MKHLIWLFAIVLALADCCIAQQAKHTLRIAGTVVSSEDKPIPRAKVVATTMDGVKKPAIVFADKKGAFACSVAVSDKASYYSVSAVADGYTCASDYGEVGSPKEFQLKLWPEKKLRVKVVDEKGKPVTGASVTLEYCHAFGNGGASADIGGLIRGGMLKPLITGRDGTATLRHLPSQEDMPRGSTMISISKPGRASIPSKTISQQDRPDEITIVQPPACKLQGVLYLPNRAGTAPKGTSITLQFVGEEYDSRTVTTDGKGKFVFDQIRPGKHNLFLGESWWSSRGDKGYVTPEQRPWVFPAKLGIEVTPARPVTMNLDTVPACVVTGTVTDKATGAPLADALVAANHAGRPKGVCASTSLTDKAGVFTVMVAPGEVSVVLLSVGDESVGPGAAAVSFELTEGEAKSDVAFKFSPTGIDEDQLRYSGEARKAPAPDFEMKAGAYDLAWQGDFYCFDNVWNRIDLKGDKARNEIGKLPGLKSEKPEFFAFGLDSDVSGKALLMAIDESGGTGKGYDTVCLDTNRNGDLSDEMPVRFERANEGACTPWVEVQSHQGPLDGEHTDHPIKVRLRVNQLGKIDSLRLERKGAWVGIVDSNKGKVQFALVDTNYNGLYGEPSRYAHDGNTSYSGDFAFADTNGFGRVVPLIYDAHSFQLYGVTKAVGKFYTVTANPMGNKVSIEPYGGPMGKLLVRAGNIGGLKGSADQMGASGNTAWYNFTTSPGTPADLPAGDYKIEWLSMQLADKNGRKVLTTCTLERPVHVGSGELAEVSIDGPLSLAINPEKKSMAFKPGETTKINWYIKVGGMTLTAIGDRSPKYSPQVKFFNSAGKLIATTTGGYT
jgi:hypothetical protein